MIFKPKKRGLITAAAFLLAFMLLFGSSASAGKTFTNYVTGAVSSYPPLDDLRDAAVGFAAQTGLMQSGGAQEAQNSSSAPSENLIASGTGMCGDGFCDSEENVSACFIDCGSGSDGSSCSAIIPVPSGSSASALSSSMQDSADSAYDDSLQPYLPTVQASVNDEGEVSVFESGEAEAASGYIIQLSEEPEFAVSSRIERGINDGELEVKLLEEKISAVSTKGISAVSGNVKKLLLKRQLDAKSAEVESLRQGREAALSENRAKLSNEHNAFRRSLKRNQLSVQESQGSKIRGEFQKAFNGVVMDISEEEARGIARLPGVKNVFPNLIRQVDLMTSVPYIHADDAWNLNDGNGYKLTGKGTSIAIIDTGVDYTHPDLGGCFVNPASGSNSSGPSSSAGALAAPSSNDGYGSNIAYSFDPITNKIAYADSVAPSSNAVISFPAYANQLGFSRLSTIPDSIKIVSSSPAFDVDRDGNLEFVIRRDMGDIWRSSFEIYEKTSGNNNSFSLVQTISLPGNSDSYYPDDVGDGDRDNLTELVVYGRTQDNFSIRLYESASITGFPSAIAWQLPDGWWAVGAKIADTDNDGKREVVVAGQADSSTHRIAVHENVGNNNYQQTYFQAFPEVHTSQAMAVLEDADNDGRKEIFYSGLVAGGSRIYAIESTGDNAYQQIWFYDMVMNDSQLVNVMDIVYAGDTDGDGMKEFLAGGRKTVPDLSFPMFAVFFLFESAASNSFSKIAEFWLPMGLWDGSAASLADVDADGINEIILSAGKTVKIYRNVGNNAWQEAWTATSADDPADIGIGDYNGNGRSEVIFEEGTSTAIYESTGFASPPPSQVCGNGLCESGENASSCPADCSPQTPPPSNQTATCKVIGGWDFVNNDADPMDDHGHGTHVAATAAGNGAIKGVAPDAKIYAYKVCNSGGSCADSAIIAAIELAVDPNQDGNLSDHADVISISLGGGGTPDDPDAIAVDNAFDSGVVVSVSAGNSGPSSGTVKCPSCARKSISVAAWCRPEHVGVDSRCPSSIASFSSRGPVTWSGGTISKPDISAPGVSICAAEWDSAWYSYRCFDSSHVSISGTSMAAPHVSGAAALVKQAHPTWSSQQIKDALVSSAVDLGLDSYAQGSGLVDVLAAIGASGTLPVASLETGGKVSGNASIRGTASGVNFSQYVLEIGSGIAPSSWTRIAQSSSPVTSGVLGSLNTESLKEGDYTLRLAVSNSMGEVNQKFSMIKVDNVFLTSPPNKDVVSGKNLVVINGTVAGSGFSSYRVEYGIGASPTSWSAGGISLSGSGLQQKRYETLATWDAGVAASAGFYTLRLTVNYGDGSANTELVSIYVDPSLQKGWPQRIPENCHIEGSGVFTCYSVLFNPTVADINSDGKSEIITATRQIGTMIPRIYVFNPDGSIFSGWPVNGSVAPAVADINLDGVKEIVSTDDTTWNNLKIMRPDGSVIARAFSLDNNIILSDLDRNFSGREVLTSTNAFRIDHSDGSRYLEKMFSTQGGAAGSVGDINNDGINEFVLFNYTGVWVFDEKGNRVPGWPQQTTASYIYSRPVIGDLDGDGFSEIVMGGNDGKLYAWLHNGVPVSGFPVNVGFTVVSNPSLGDINGDGRLEIVITDDEAEKIYVYNDNGQLMPGWPRKGPGTTAIIGDIDSDGDMEVIDGNYAYHHDGTLVSGFPKYIPNSWELAEHSSSSAALDDLDGDGDIELIIGPTQFEFAVYVYDLPGAYNPDKIQWGQVRHDAQHTGNYNSIIELEPKRFTKYYYYNLTDNDCSVNATLAAFSGNVSVSVRNSPYVCDDTWDAEAKASPGKPAVVLQSALGRGSYALKVDGLGAYSLNLSSYCREDMTSPVVEADALPLLINGDILLTARVSDSNGLSGCDSCISNDGVCDSEWAPASADFSFGEKSGACSRVLNSSALNDGSYEAAFRAVDVSNNSGTASRFTFLDRTAPVIWSASVPSADAGSLITVTADVSDNFAVANVTASVQQPVALLKDNASGFYTGFVGTPSAIGTYGIAITAVDAIGNSASENVTARTNEIVNLSSPIPLVTAQYSASSADISADSNVHVVWEDSISGTPDVYYSRMTPSGRLDVLAMNITSGVYNSRSPSVDAANGIAHIVWEDDRDGNREIYYSRLQGSSKLIDNLRVTFNSFDSASPKVAASQSGAAIFWLDDREGTRDLYYAFVDSGGSKVAGDTKLASSVQAYDVASALPVRVAWVSGNVISHALLQGSSLAGTASLGSGNEVAVSAVQDSYILASSPYGLFLYVVGNNATSNFSVAASGSNLTIAASDSVHLFWGSATYAKYSLAGKLLVQPREVGQSSARGLAAKDYVVALAGSGKLGVLTSAGVEQAPPSIQYAVVSDLRAESAVIGVATSEPTLVSAAYSGGEASDGKLSDYHRLVLAGLAPSTRYDALIIASDIAGNAMQSALSFNTEALRNRPALPTTFFGSVKERDGTPVAGINVTASWQDSNGNLRTASSRTLTVQEAVALNNSGLAGYYLFNKANVDAKDGTQIALSAPDMVNNVSIGARPGSLPINVTASIVIDRMPPVISIHSPAQQVYASPFLKFNYTVNEPITIASFVLNEQAPVVVTGLAGTEINVTARTGANTFVVTAKDLIGLSTQAAVGFTVEDKVPPVVAANPIAYAKKVAKITANASDSTNSLSHCEVCIGDGCAWQGAISEFRPGDMTGKCSFDWNTSAFPDGIYSVAFRATDISGNSGTSLPLPVRVDNTLPQQISPSVRAVPGQRKLVVEWAQSQDSEFVRYVIYRKQSPAQVIASITDRSQAFYEDTSVQSSAQYSYAVVAEDAAGNEGVPVFENGTAADVIPPAVTINFPKASAYNTTLMSLSYSVNEAVIWCGYRLNSRPVVQASGSAAFSSDEGSNYLSVYCNDTGMNQGSSSVSFTSDTIAPAKLTLNVSPVSGQNRLALVWTPSSVPDFGRYNIYRSQSAFTTTEGVSKITYILGKNSVQYIDTGLSSQQTYYYAVAAADSVGNENRTVTAVAGTVADTIPPQLALTSPSDKVYMSYPVRLEYSANEPLAGCAYSLNGAAPVSVFENSTIAPLEGRNSLSLECRDLSQNSASAAVGFDYDAMIPGRVQLSVTPVPRQNALALSWQPSEARDLGSYAIYRSLAPFSISTQASRIATTKGTQYTDTGLQSETTYHYAIAAIDLYSNENASVASSSGTVEDTAAPGKLLASASPVAAQERIQLDWEKSNATDFDHYTIYRSQSSFSMVGSATPIAVINNKNTRSYTDAGVVSDTTYYYAITASDAKGNEDPSVVASSARVYDLTPPKLAISEPLNKTYTARSLALKISSDEPANCTYRLNSGTPAEIISIVQITAAEGGNLINVSCRDANSNYAYQSVVFSTDTVAPARVAIRSVLPSKGQNSLSVSWAASGAPDLWQYNVYRSITPFPSTDAAVKVASTSSTTYTDMALQSGQTYYYAVAAVDVNGNENREANITSGTVADTIPPAPVSLLPVETVPHKTELRLSWIPSAEPDLSNYSVYRSAAQFASAAQASRIASTENSTYTDSGLESETSYYYAVTALDYEGNEDKNAISVTGKTADITPPEITLISPAGANYTNRSVLLEYSTSEDAACSYSINNAVFRPAEPVISAEEGPNRFSLNCSDASGNSALASVSFSVDTIPPAPVTLTVNQTPRMERIVLSWQQSAASDFASYKVYRSNAPFTVASSSSLIAEISSRVQSSYTDNNVKSGQSYYYAVTASDILGNVNNSVIPSSITVGDLVPPKLSVKSPISGNTYKILAVPLEYSADEPLLGCSYYLNGGAPKPADSNTTIVASEGGNDVILSCADLNQNPANVTVSFSVNTIPPPPVTGLSLYWNRGVVIEWNAVAASDIDHYAVYRKTSVFSDSGSAILIATTTGTAYSDFSVASETAYFYAVTAVDAVSNENTSVASRQITTPDIIAPDPIQGLAVAPAPKQPELRLGWQPSPAADFRSYNVYRHTSGFSDASSAALIANITDRNMTSYADSNLESSAAYYYAVTAVDFNGNENRAVSPVSGTVADLTAPVVLTQQVASPVAGQVSLSALVSDNSLSRSCEICIAQGSCDWVSAESNFAEGSRNGTCSYIWKTPAQGGAYSYGFRVNDTSLNQKESQLFQADVLDVSQQIPFSIQLFQGWNLISFPVIPQDNSARAVLEPIRGKYSKAFYYDSVSGVWHAHFAESSIFNPEETLVQFELGKSYWIEATENASLAVNGTRVPRYVSPLASGWNLIGSPYEVPVDAGQALSSLDGSYNVVFAYNASEMKWERYSPFPSVSQPNTIAQLQPGVGYMIDMVRSVTWSPARD